MMTFLPRVGAFVVQDREYLGRVVSIGNVSVDIAGVETARVPRTYYFGIASMQFYYDALSAIKAII